MAQMHVRGLQYTFVHCIIKVCSNKSNEACHGEHSYSSILASWNLTVTTGIKQKQSIPSQVQALLQAIATFGSDFLPLFACRRMITSGMVPVEFHNVHLVYSLFAARMIGHLMPFHHIVMHHQNTGSPCTQEMQMTCPRCISSRAT